MWQSADGTTDLLKALRALAPGAQLRESFGQAWLREYDEGRSQWPKWSAAHGTAAIIDAPEGEFSEPRRTPAVYRTKLCIIGAANSPKPFWSAAIDAVRPEGRKLLFTVGTHRVCALYFSSSADCFDCNTALGRLTTKHSGRAKRSGSDGEGHRVAPGCIFQPPNAIHDEPHVHARADSPQRLGGGAAPLPMQSLDRPARLRHNDRKAPPPPPLSPAVPPTPPEKTGAAEPVRAEEGSGRAEDALWEVSAGPAEEALWRVMAEAAQRTPRQKTDAADVYRADSPRRHEQVRWANPAESEAASQASRKLQQPPAVPSGRSGDGPAASGDRAVSSPLQKFRPSALAIPTWKSEDSPRGRSAVSDEQSRRESAAASAPSRTARDSPRRREEPRHDARVEARRSSAVSATLAEEGRSTTWPLGSLGSPAARSGTGPVWAADATQPAEDGKSTPSADSKAHVAADRSDDLRAAILGIVRDRKTPRERLVAMLGAQWCID
eukprot:TRINITY_DN15394_c0_g1_i1.p1 TRINITY_DN15394_c0_g1~~TRINITY_DN15394_c0_g1_i1.p1  ORF type:complete len:494 (+),score=110.63 TRINITY_DN15394_c0_g1_i1:39-1520(+)